MTQEKKVKNVIDLSITEMLKTNRFLNPKEDGEGNVLTDYPIFARAHSKGHLHKKEFYSADDFSVWVNKLGCKTRVCGPLVIWEEISREAYLKLAQHGYDFEETFDTALFAESA